ncbi:hypothetical protein RZ760_002725 [Providencia rettgeri]|nr:hypothetical protein [Providencia rettgeri]
MKKENNIIKSSHLGILDFENDWGETLTSVEITHYVATIFNGGEREKVYRKIENIIDKKKIENFMRFTYYLRDETALDYWKVKIKTKSNKVYSSGWALRCSIRNVDKGKVILSVKGEDKMMYISMESGDCSKKLNEVNDD